MGANPRSNGRYTGRGGHRGSHRGGRIRGKSFSKRHRFDSSRVQENEAENEKDIADPVVGVEGQVASDEDDEASGDDDQVGNVDRPYASLMRSLAVDSAPAAKKRKINHPDLAKRQKKSSAKAEDAESSDGSPEDPDEVDEPEGDPEKDHEGALPEDLFGDEEDKPDLTDPFEAHFAEPDENELPVRLGAIQASKWQPKRIAVQGVRTLLSVPIGADGKGISTPMAVAGPEDLKLKRRLRENMQSKRPNFDSTESMLSPFLFQYYDIMFCERNISNAESLRRIACLHAVNHVFKTRDRVIKNNAKLSREEESRDLELRDQGFTRPKVLFLLPTRNSCFKMVEMICSICEPEQQENRKRFDESYLDKEDRFSVDKPADFRDLFQGNDDDMFRVGVKFTRKTIKYFAQFYNSDILFASPLGLRMALGSEEENKVDYDFLSSIEVVVVDQADALLMQNWEHVEYIFERLNLQPKDAHGCDFSRVRNWYLEDQSKYFRQTVILTAFNTPELSELFRCYCNNWAGKARIQQEYPGVIQQLLGVKAKQTFCRFESPSVGGDPDARFAYFTSAIIPTLTKRAKSSSGTLIFVPSYLDFVRVRNYFASNPAAESLSFGTISEYADVPEASRARSHFLTGRHRVLLYTERAHHFRRYLIKGVKTVIMYGLPDNPLFYREIVGGYLQSSERSLHVEHGQGSVRVMFSKYDVLKLERVVGTQRVGKMIHERGDTFEFV